MEVVQALLAKGASPNINAMGVTAFLAAAGVGTGARAGGAGAASPNGASNTALMDLLIQHGADVNAQVTGTKTYNMRIPRQPSANEGMTALHAAAQSGRTDLVRYLLEKGADPAIVDSNGKKAIDLVGAGASNPAAPAKPAAGANGAPPGPGGRGGQGGAAAANAAEIRALLQNAASKN
jgi:ankyrin repeat protein